MCEVCWNGDASARVTPNTSRRNQLVGHALFHISFILLSLSLFWGFDFVGHLMFLA
jgi:hypothetical protein